MKVERRPKAGYASKIKSHIRMAVLDKFRIDLLDAKVFPGHKKRWQSFVDTLAKEGLEFNSLPSNFMILIGLSDTQHFDEISPETVEKLFELFNNLVLVLNKRGEKDYCKYLECLPAKFHHRLNYLLQYMAQVNQTLV